MQQPKDENIRPTRTTNEPSFGNRGSQNNKSSNQDSGGEPSQPTFQPPVINLPKGGGAIQGIGEKFQANPVTGTGSMTVPIAMSPGRGGFTPQLALSYDSGAGNSCFGLGWNIGLPSIQRKTQTGLPQYDGLPKYYDAFESDVFVLSGAEDLVPVLENIGTADEKPYTRIEGEYKVYRYIPRVEGLFARIEKWVHQTHKSSFWKSITKENITTIYGQSKNAKIVDPKDTWKVFEWKIEKTFDDKGNVICYDYKKEDGVGLNPKPIFEKNRSGENTYNQTYLKRVLYGSTIPYQKAEFEENNQWLFSLVFDYGEHFEEGDNIPAYEAKYDWQVRQDIFSSFRSGFDIRTYRLCQRILMFHHFETELGIPNYLVKATHFEYEANAILTTVKSIIHTGYQYHADTGKYSAKSYPPVSFKYTEQKIDNTIYEIHSADLPNAPRGIDGQQFQFNDFYGEGLNGILSQKNGAWYYKRNEGNGAFGSQQLVAQLPSLALNANVQVADFGGDGLTDVVVQTDTMKGYFELSEEAEWSHFKPFPNPVNFDLNDPSLRMIDLDGNGIPDILVTENDCFIWYAADAKEGYKAPRQVFKVLDEDQGARIVFYEKFQTIFLADMSGDGLTDIVRIRNGEICYWANMGYGRFSAKIIMANAPHFDYPDYFDPNRIRFADIDGSGSTDVLYLGRKEIRYWLNQSGNSWSDAKIIKHFPKTSNLHTVSVFDLLGNGTACIVWSSPLPAEAGRPMKYIKLMGDSQIEGNKPYLLKEVNNNMGAIIRMKYEASTKFYLEDRKNDKPWITKLPFPVQVLTRQEIYDAIAGNHFVTRYAYHHGYFDKVEREFRGFGMVEQWDTEDYETLKENTLFEVIGQNWSEEIDIMPPVYTKTWFHNGYYHLDCKISRQYEKEYYQGDKAAWLLDDTQFPESLCADEKREAARALKGSAIRVEVYGLDGSVEAMHPYTVAETKFHIKTIQARGKNRYASFYVCQCESLNYQYERNPVDPRIAHQHTLEIDNFGNVLKSVAIVYPRRITTPYSEQQQQYITYTEADFINKKEVADFYRIGVPYAQRTYEITGLTLTGPFKKKALKKAIAHASEIPYEETPSLGVQKRLVTANKSSFYNKDLTEELPFGELAFHALPYQTYEAVYTQGLIDKFNKAGNVLINSTTIEQEGGFIPMDNLWWRPSGKAIFAADKFYLPIQQLDPFGHPYEMGYDAYHLAMVQTSTAIYGKTILSTTQLDYRTLQPSLLTDPNGNQSEVLLDELGMVIITAIKGKNGEGDSLADYTIIPYAQTDVRATIYNNQHDYLQRATSFFYYDLDAWRRDGQPNYALSIVRETHVAEENGTPTKTQINFSYSDGFGQTIMLKVQAEPGAAFRLENGAVVNDHAAIRWVGNGRTVFNNKGNPVKQYEPYFSHSFDYEKELELVEYGVTPILYYDVLGRNIRTDIPDGSFSRVEFTPWKQISYDQNDTVLESDWFAQRGSPNPIGNEPNIINNPANYPKRAAWVAAQHANTPKVEYLDTLGRVFLMVDDDGTAEKVKTHFKLDILGNQVEVTDALDRLISRNHFNILNEPIHTESMDAGRRWMLPNILGNPIYQWNGRDFKTRLEYDVLQRNTATFVRHQQEAEKLVYFTVYGEQLTNPEQTNHFGQVYQLYDQAGRITSQAFDFKGNPLAGNQQVCKDYKNTIDWLALHGLPDTSEIDTAATPILEAEVFSTTTKYDALNRPTEAIAPNNSITSYSYNEANFLETITLSPAGGDAGGGKTIVKNINYDTKGQRTKIQYGNGVTTTYEYERETFRLSRLRSTRSSDNAVLQDLQYHYDPVGNITNIRDEALSTIFFANQLIEPHAAYYYDPLYRLTKATGREHIGQSSEPNNPNHFEIVANANDGQAMRRYKRCYEYDKLGNILSVNHKAGMGTPHQNGWTRTYQYQEESFLEAGKYNNRLTATLSPAGGGAGGGLSNSYTHDIHGNMTTMPHLSQMLWDFADQFKEVDLGSGGKEYYTYTMGGGKDFGIRTRKVTEKAGGKICDRIYIGDFEMYRERTTADGIGLERETLHIQDDKGRIALVDTLTIENSTTLSPAGGGAGGGNNIRYQLNNHLGSSCLEVDKIGDLISYEEYYPFGASSFRAGRSIVEVNLKRHRYVGKERDESTGLDYYGARYYGSWFCRFVSVDDLKDEYPFYTPFQYAGNKPISFVDLDGFEPLSFDFGAQFSLILSLNQFSKEKKISEDFRMKQNKRLGYQFNIGVGASITRGDIMVGLNSSVDLRNFGFGTKSYGTKKPDPQTDFVVSPSFTTRLFGENGNPIQLDTFSLSTSTGVYNEFSHSFTLSTNFILNSSNRNQQVWGINFRVSENFAIHTYNDVKFGDVFKLPLPLSDAGDRWYTGGGGLRLIKENEFNVLYGKEVFTHSRKKIGVDGYDLKRPIFARYKDGNSFFYTPNNPDDQNLNTGQTAIFRQGNIFINSSLLSIEKLNGPSHMGPQNFIHDNIFHVPKFKPAGLE